MPSITAEFRRQLEAQGKKYCHRCDEIYIPGDPEFAEHEEHERARAEKWRSVGLDPYP